MKGVKTKITLFFIFLSFQTTFGIVFSLLTITTINHTTMSRIEKIAFISSFWSLLKIKDQLVQFLDSDLDLLIHQIIEKIKKAEDPNPLLHVFHMPVYLN